MRKNFCFPITVAVALGVASFAHALTPCQTACNTQYYATVDTLWQTPRPASTPLPDYRQEVLGALEKLNACIAACPAEPAELAAGKPANASLFQVGYEAGKAVDGNPATSWWAKSSSAQWLQVDLGVSAILSKVQLAWSGSNYATSYQVQVSTDARSWTTVSSTTAGKGGAVAHAFTERSARYVRINCTSAANRNGYAVSELGVFGR